MKFLSANLYFIFGNAKLLREIWGEFTNNGLFLLIIIHGTGNGIAWNGARLSKTPLEGAFEAALEGERRCLSLV